MRNQFAVGQGDALYVGVFTLRQLRNARSENGGPLTPRRRRFLRRFIMPYVSEKPVTLDTQFVISIPRSAAMRAPQAARQLLAPHFEELDIQFYFDHPWYGDPAMQVSDAAIDNELGTELDKRQRQFWDETQPDGE